MLIVVYSSASRFSCQLRGVVFPVAQVTSSANPALEPAPLMLLDIATYTFSSTLLHSSIADVDAASLNVLPSSYFATNPILIIPYHICIGTQI